MFSRHDINSPKEACSLTDSPYWNLTDNDFVFAEAGAPWGVGREMRYGLVFQKKSPLSPAKDQLGEAGDAVFYHCVGKLYLHLIVGDAKRSVRSAFRRGCG